MAIKQQRLDIQTELEIADELVKRDAQILQVIKDIVRKKIANPSWRQAPQIKPLLYNRYRGNGFPLKLKGNKRPPEWRSLTPWMKVQLCGLVMCERDHLAFTIKLHPQLLEELSASNTPLKDYLRDRLTRCLRARFHTVPWFFFVLEDGNKTGKVSKPPHAHGSIVIPEMDLPLLSNGQVTHRFKRLVAQKGERVAKAMYAKEQILDAMKAAAGLLNRPMVWNGMSQRKNVWLKAPNPQLFQTDWVTYAFKNIGRSSSKLGDKRLAVSKPLLTEAQRFWKLLKKGEAAISQWD